VSHVNGNSYGIGKLELVSLANLRSRVGSTKYSPMATKVSIVVGDVGKMHRQPENERALFQVASQFNLLEMVSPGVTPEHGVTRYEHDHTQGPACAIACGAATIYRNYFAPVHGSTGQTTTRQLDGLYNVGLALARTTGLATTALWEMKNGYALCSQAGLDAIAGHLRTLNEDGLDMLRGELCIGLHWDVDVTNDLNEARRSVTQAFCSALPVAYTNVDQLYWEPFAALVLEAAYEATILAGLLNASRGASNSVLLTQLGGGAFGNSDEWIRKAMQRALRSAAGLGLNVKIVSYGQPSNMLQQLVKEFG
jgi:hypothetical protein